MDGNQLDRDAVIADMTACFARLLAVADETLRTREHAQTWRYGGHGRLKYVTV